jgi:DNA/RNA-binding domain of Phe-tRNA-synthetase-like protein
MFRAWGMDPSKYRPSSEALLRRVVQGKGLYRVSNLVDIGNLGSIETGWPYGCYDRSRLGPPIVFRHGAAGELYEGIGKRTWHLEGRPVLADAHGPFGSPISDSTRSMITKSARAVLAVIYAPSGVPDASIEAATARLQERLAQFAGASATRAAICR